jgi:hypothetical protein
MQRAAVRVFASGVSKSFRHKEMQLLFALLALSFVVILSSWIPDIFFAEQVQLSVRKAPRTVVSISSFSQRVFHMQACLDTVFAQSQPPDRVIITIPRKFRLLEKTAPPSKFLFLHTYTNTYQNETEVDIVNWFSKYTGAAQSYRVNLDVHKTSYVYEIGVLTVQFVDSDWGPATKLIGALLLEKDNDTVVITLDDDMEYHRDTVQWLSTHIPPGTALSFGCEMLTGDGRATIDFHQWSIHDFYMSTPRVCQGWLIGWTAVSYRVSSFGPDIYTFLESLPVACFNTDDIWLSGYLAQRGVPRIYAPMVLYHGKHTLNWELSLQTVVGVSDKALSCARHLFHEL